MICAVFPDTLCRKLEGFPFREGARLPYTTKLLCNLTLSQVLATELTAHNRLRVDLLRTATSVNCVIMPSPVQSTIFANIIF